MSFTPGQRVVVKRPTVGSQELCVEATYLMALPKDLVQLRDDEGHVFNALRQHVFAGVADFRARGSEDRLDRAHLLRHNEREVRRIYAAALRQGLPPDCVICVSDLRDREAERLAVPLLGRERVNALKEEMARQQRIPTAIYPVPFEEARRVIGGTTPNGAQWLDMPAPIGHFKVAVIAAGGTTYTQLACVA
jgi:hypothetical protein